MDEKWTFQLEHERLCIYRTIFPSPSFVVELEFFSNGSACVHTAGCAAELSEGFGEFWARMFSWLVQNHLLGRDVGPPPELPRTAS